ncbi:DUF1800 domain-containing protein [Limnoglobus roseus]|uniref:DUF1800 domain-containing protein n=1 Tax=Limnoglobus roseus TaxID=2598579 RepID=A0A5C1AJL8_9BACT|nr:DUF1800 domain-containing protein [Limnoglobus roseus]QEL18196.1 hypothetical protein PX52LOC_05210 [Limnoglobus roseus]
MANDITTAWQAYTPTADNPWDAKKVGHLYRRAGFGASSAELDAGVKDGPEVTLDRMLNGGPADADFEQSSEFMASERSLPAGTPAVQLAAWWLYRMLRTPHPLREKLSLFWHNHFATSIVKVQNARYMLGQYRLVHRHALGNFRNLLQEMTLDPAMLIWLDAKESKRGKPNENYARELMELFTLGIGNYTEKDIREAAKAFTGYGIKQGKATFVEKEHDAGPKTVLGKTGDFAAKDVVDICLAQKACPRFLVTKLYHFLFSDAETPKAEFLQPLVRQYAESDFDTGKLVATMLRSDHFFSASVYRAKVKSPVEFAVGIVRVLEGNVGPLSLANSLEALGQVLFAPPSVKGWDGGPAWLNGQTLLFRQNLALALTSTEDARFGRRCDPAAVLSRYDRRTDEAAIAFFLRVFLQDDVSAEAREQLAGYANKSKATKYPPFWSADDVTKHRLRTLAHLTLTLPEFQLN